MVGAVVIGLSWQRALAWYAIHQLLPEQRAAFSEFETKPIYFPASWSIVDPINSDVLTSLTMLCVRNPVSSIDASQITKWSAQLAAGKPLGEDNWTSIAQLLDSSIGWANQFAETALNDGYDMELLCGWPGSDGPKDGVKAAINAAQLLELQSYYLYHREETADAINSALAILCLGRRAGAAPVIAHLVAVKLQGTCATILSRLCMECNNADLLRFTLEKLNRNEDALYPMVLAMAGVLPNISNVRGLIRHGHPADLAPGHPECYYQAQWFKGMWTPTNGDMPVSMQNKDLTRMVNCILFCEIARPNAKIASARECCSKAIYDLARLQISRRILLLDNEIKDNQNASSPVAGHLETDTKDPFTDNAYRWSDERQSYYSVGPDRVDQLAREQYDPKNGDFSPGDIF
jgi:hypothetical protein